MSINFQKYNRAWLTNNNTTRTICQTTRNNVNDALLQGYFEPTENFVLYAWQKNLTSSLIIKAICTECPKSFA